MYETIKSWVKILLNSRYRNEKLQKYKWNTELQKVRRNPRYKELTTNILGKPLLVPDSASFAFMFREIFMEHIYKFHSMKDDPLIIDCGANIGLSVLYFKKLYPLARIIAFEPDEKIYKYLKSNIQSFAYTNVQMINKGLWNVEGRLSFVEEGADSGRIDLDANNEKNSIRVTRLSHFLDQPIDFLKMDIEGAEVKVLEECKDKLRVVNNIFIEYHSFIGKAQELHNLLSILNDSGFRVYISTPGLHSPHPFTEVITYNGMDMQLNIYGIRR